MCRCPGAQRVRPGHGPSELDPRLCVAAMTEPAQGCRGPRVSLVGREQPVHRRQRAVCIAVLGTEAASCHLGLYPEGDERGPSLLSGSPPPVFSWEEEGRAGHCYGGLASRPFPIFCLGGFMLPYGGVNRVRAACPRPRSSRGTRHVARQPHPVESLWGGRGGSWL